LQKRAFNIFIQTKFKIMGWDAHSSVEVDFENMKIKDNTLDQIFRERSKLIIKKAGSVDGAFRLGSLDVSTCARMLEKATSESCWTEDGWSIEKVKELSAGANWDFHYVKRDYWAYLSAKEFLSTCAENNLSISFSW
jgi:histidyl-tRNA synthetase